MKSAMSYEMREYLLRKIIAKFGWSKEKSDASINEFCKFLELALLAPPSFIQVVPEVDEIWHLALLQTESYQELCNNLSPGNFLHHKSQTFEQYSDGVSSEILLDECLSWTINYLARFGPYTPEAIQFWTFPKYLVSELDWSIDEVNSLRNIDSRDAQKLFHKETI